MSGPTHTIHLGVVKTEHTMLDFGTQCSENKISAPPLADNELCTNTRHRHGKTHEPLRQPTEQHTSDGMRCMNDVNERINEGRSLYLARPTQSLLSYCFLLAFHRFMTSDTAPKKRKQHRFTACLARSEHTTIEFGRDQKKKKKKPNINRVGNRSEKHHDNDC